MTTQTHSPCRLGIIGAGRIGKLHAENIKHQLPCFDLQAIADPCLDRDWAARLGIPQLFSSAEDILQHPGLDAVLIASPSHLHASQIKAASAANKAIFCEKPIGLPEDDIAGMLALIDQNKSLLQIGFNRRFDSNFSNLQQRVQQGEIGQVQLIRITSRDPACPPKGYVATSGGMFLDMTIHDFDMARFLSGSEVVEVFASGAVLIDPDFETYDDVDTAIIQLRFANGALGVIDNSRQAVYGYDQRIEVLGSEGMLLAKNVLNNTVEGFSKQQTQQANPNYFFLERYQQAFVEELRVFHTAWVNKAKSPVSGWDAYYALGIAKAAKQSLKTRQPVYLG